MRLCTINIGAVFHEKNIEHENMKTIFAIFFILVDVIYFRTVPITPGITTKATFSITPKETTDLCILKVIIYRILQLPQFLLLFFLFLFLLLGQSSFSLFIIVILEFLNITGQNTVLKVGSSLFGIWGSLQQRACHGHWSSGTFMFLILFTCTA